MTTEAPITEEQLCKFLHVSREAVHRFRTRDNDPIPFMKAGRRYLYLQSAVLKWAEREGQRAKEKRKARTPNGRTLRVRRRVRQRSR